MTSLYQPINAAARIGGSASGKFTKKIFKRVFQRSKLSTHVEVNEDPNDSSGLDILCVGENAQSTDLNAPHAQHCDAILPNIAPNPIIHPLRGNPMIPREAAVEYLPEVGSGRRKSSASDYLTSMIERDAVVEEDDSFGSLNLDDFPSTPSNQRQAHVDKALGHLTGTTPPASERSPAQMQAREHLPAQIPASDRFPAQWPTMERRPRVIPLPSAPESYAKDYMRHRRDRTRNSALTRNHSRRSNRRLSFEPQSMERQDSMLLMIQADRYIMTNELSKPDIDLGALRTRSEVIDAAVPGANLTFKAEWETYLKDYCAGRYNIIYPPKPPRRHSTFTYLPALPPRNEDDRIAALERLNPEWSACQETEGMRMISTAQAEFEAPGAAISLVVSNVEILKVQQGYGLQAINRSDSIAAHALLSTEVLVVLDTHTDWRFAGNPLVMGDPKIRFFAGAPMMTCSGAVIGVFAIFGYEPREEFTVMQRNRLTNYSSTTMSNIMPRSKNIPTPPIPMVMTRPRTPIAFGQPTPQASFDSADMAIHPLFREEFKLNMSDFELTPQRTVEPPDFNNKISSWNADVPTPGHPSADALLTPPSSGSTSPDDDEPTLRQPPPGLGKNHKDLFLAVHHPNLTYRERQSDGTGVGSLILRSWTPRPFSDRSDLTSIGGHEHPNTPFNALFLDDDARSRADDASYFDHSSAMDRSFVYETDKARLVIEHTASQPPAAFARDDTPDTETEYSFERQASRPLLSYDEPPEERGLY